MDASSDAVHQEGVDSPPSVDEETPPSSDAVTGKGHDTGVPAASTAPVRKFILFPNLFNNFHCICSNIFLLFFDHLR